MMMIYWIKLIATPGRRTYIKNPFPLRATYHKNSLFHWSTEPKKKPHQKRKEKDTVVRTV